MILSSDKANLYMNLFQLRINQHETCNTGFMKIIYFRHA